MCHCSACRSWTGSTGQAVVLYPTDQVKITGELVPAGAPFRGASSMPAGFSKRMSCAKCFACVMNDHTHTPYKALDLCGGLLDFGPGGFKPPMHVNCALCPTPPICPPAPQHDARALGCSRRVPWTL